MVNQQVTVTVKVKRVEVKEKVKNHHSGKVYENQDCVVGDSTTYGRVVFVGRRFGTLRGRKYM